MPYFRFKIKGHSYFWLVLITYIIRFLDDTNRFKQNLGPVGHENRNLKFFLILLKLKLDFLFRGNDCFHRGLGGSIGVISLF